jgi:glycosyltransferase involved in cell wall biosynthesis
LKPRRVLLLSYALDLGGSERQLTEIAKALDPARFTAHVGCLLSGGIRASELAQAGIPIVTFPMNSFFSFEAVRQAFRLATYIRRHAIDLVHAFDVPMDIFGVPVAKASLRPVVLSSQRAHRSLTSGARLRVLRVSDHMADGIVVNCEFIRRHLIDDEQVPARKIHLCYNGLDETVFTMRQANGNAARPLQIGCVCALRPEKNLPLLLRAFARAVRSHNTARLLIVGSGSEEHDLKSLAGELGIRNATTFIPATPDVARWLREMDIFVLPSRTEALSNALMEAMACGCAALASDVGGNPELIGNNERGLLFPSEDVDALTNALLDLLGNAELRRRKGDAARAFVESRLTIAASVHRMTEIYDSFLTGDAP